MIERRDSAGSTRRCFESIWRSVSPKKNGAFTVSCRVPSEYRVLWKCHHIVALRGSDLYHMGFGSQRNSGTLEPVFFNFFENAAFACFFGGFARGPGGFSVDNLLDSNAARRALAKTLRRKCCCHQYGHHCEGGPGSRAEKFGYDRLNRAYIPWNWGGGAIFGL
jgi:hypothetical protein